jgi:hypothetical protein
MQAIIYAHIGSILDVGNNTNWREKYPSESDLLNPAALMRHLPELRARSQVGFISLHQPHRGYEVSLQQCFSCNEPLPPRGTAALVYHRKRTGRRCLR